MRFNFRGIGRSEGAYDEGRGELDDLLAVVRTQAPEATLRALLVADAGLMDIEVTGTSLEDAVLDLLKKELA